MIPFPKQVNRGVLELRGLSSIQAILLLSYLQLYHSSSKGECWLHFLWENRTVKMPTGRNTSKRHYSHPALHKQ